MIHIYASAHKWSQQVCTAFAEGAKCPIVPPAPLRSGGVFMYGALRGLLPTLRQAQREGRTWYYADNGYFRAGKTEESYFRVTRNALQHDGSGSGDKERWKALGIAMAPWRANGSHVVVCPPGHLFAGTFGFSAERWLEQTLETLKLHTDREIRVRRKVSWNDAKPAHILAARNQKPKTSVTTALAEDLAGAWALVTHSSNSAVEALIAGMPVICTDRCGASAMGSSDLSTIERPRVDGDREAWAAVIAANQWTLSEMRSGRCAKDLGCNT